MTVGELIELLKEIPADTLVRGGEIFSNAYIMDSCHIFNREDGSIAILGEEL